MNSSRLILAAVIAGLLFPSSGAAHHSFAMYDEDTTYTIEGTILEWSFRNPHATLILEVEEEGGTVVYQLESGGNPSGMVREGWTSNSLQTGERVRVTYNPNRSGVPGGAFDANAGDVVILVEGGPEEGVLPMELDR